MQQTNQKLTWSPKLKYEFSGFASFAEHHTDGTHERHTKFWLGNKKGRLFSTTQEYCNIYLRYTTETAKHKNGTSSATQAYRISHRCPHSSPMIHCDPQIWNFFKKINESYLFLLSFPFKWHSYLSFHSLNILHGFPYDLQSMHRVGASQIHYFSNSLKRSPRCRKGSNTTGYRQTYLILQLPCFPYAKPLTCHKGEKKTCLWHHHAAHASVSHFKLTNYANDIHKIWCRSYTQKPRHSLSPNFSNAGTCHVGATLNLNMWN